MRSLFNKISVFLKKEKLYVFLLIGVVVFNLLFLALGQFTPEDSPEQAGELISQERISEILEADPAIIFVFSFLFLSFALFAVTGAALDIAYLYFRRRNKDPIGRTRTIAACPWNFLDICKVIVIFLFAQRVIFLVDTFLFSGIPYLSKNENLRLMLSATLADIAGIAAVLYFVLNERRQEIEALGLTLGRFFANIKYGILAYIGLVPVLVSVMLASTALFRILGIPLEPQPIIVMLQEESHIPTLAYMAFFGTILGPVFEEVFFRGFAYSVFRKKFGVPTAVILSAAFFAYVHANLASFFPILCLGMLLAYIYEKTGSLIPSITVHIIHNSATLILLLFAKAITG